MLCNRLITAVATSVASGQSTYSHTYAYDAIGNFTSKSDQGNYTYAGDQGSSYANPHAVTSIGSTNFTYDNNGNMLTVTGGLSNTWNFKNQLTQAVLGGVTTTYAYDHAGQRVKYANGTTTTVYPGKGYNTDGTTPVKHIYAGSTLVATVKGTGASAAVFSVHNDHLSGSNVVTNSGGTQEEVMDYLPYGNIRLDNKAGSFDEQRKFSGHEYDADTQLSYMNARYYKSDIGRFISQDPIAKDNPSGFLSDPQQLNYYAYSRNNPLRFIDPFGLFNVETGMIESGDNLTQISQQINGEYGTSLTVDQIAQANNIQDPNRIIAGTSLALPNQTNLELRFDGKSLQAYDAVYGMAYSDLSWSAVSGSELRGFDPIPEGVWSADPNNTQKWSDVSAARKAASIIGGVTENIPFVGFKLGPWPGGAFAWGEYRTELSNGAGDRGYYMHGGAIAGSAGCIDLTSNNNSFHQWFTQTWAKPIDVIVNY